MSKRLNDRLPDSQNVRFENKILWESMRMMAAEKGLTISKFTEYAVEYFMKHEKRDMFIELKKMGIL